MIGVIKYIKKSLALAILLLVGQNMQASWLKYQQEQNQLAAQRAAAQQAAQAPAQPAVSGTQTPAPTSKGWFAGMRESWQQRQARSAQERQEAARRAEFAELEGQGLSEREAKKSESEERKNLQEVKLLSEPVLSEKERRQQIVELRKQEVARLKEDLKKYGTDSQRQKTLHTAQRDLKAAQRDLKDAEKKARQKPAGKQIKRSEAAFGEFGKGAEPAEILPESWFARQRRRAGETYSAWQARRAEEQRAAAARKEFEAWEKGYRSEIAAEELERDLPEQVRLRELERERAASAKYLASEEKAAQEKAAKEAKIQATWTPAKKEAARLAELQDKNLTPKEKEVELKKIEIMRYIEDKEANAQKISARGGMFSNLFKSREQRERDAGAKAEAERELKVARVLREELETLVDKEPTAEGKLDQLKYLKEQRIIPAEMETASAARARFGQGASYVGESEEPQAALSEVAAPEVPSATEAERKEVMDELTTIMARQAREEADRQEAAQIEFGKAQAETREPRTIRGRMRGQLPRSEAAFGEEGKGAEPAEIVRPSWQVEPEEGESWAEPTVVGTAEGSASEFTAPEAEQGVMYEQAEQRAKLESLQKSDLGRRYGAMQGTPALSPAVDVEGAAAAIEGYATDTDLTEYEQQHIPGSSPERASSSSETPQGLEEEATTY